MDNEGLIAFTYNGVLLYHKVDKCETFLTKWMHFEDILLGENNHIYMFKYVIISLGNLKAYIMLKIGTNH